MITISHKYKFIFIRSGKAAGASVQDFLEKYCLNPHVNDTQKDWQKKTVSEYGIVGPKYSSLVPASEIKKEIGEKLFNEYYKFCIVRNPYDKMVSLYFYLYREQKNVFLNGIPIVGRPIGKKRGKVLLLLGGDIHNPVTFKNFCKRMDMDNMDNYLINNKSVCDYYIRFENLEADIEKVLEKVGITDYNINELPKHHSGYRPKEKGYRQYYDEETRKMVFETHKREFEMFGYEF